MQRSVIALAFIFILFAVSLMFYDYKNAYEILPVQPPTQLDEEIDTGWREYEDQAAGFKAKFPTEPQHAVENVHSPDTKELRLYKVYASETPQGQVFMVSLVTFSDDAYKMGDDVLMHRFVNELVDSKNNNILEKMEATTYKGHKGYGFSINNPSTQMEGLVFMNGRTLVLLTELLPNNLGPSEFDQFKETFGLDTDTKDTE